MKRFLCSACLLVGLALAQAFPPPATAAPPVPVEPPDLLHCAPGTSRHEAWPGLVVCAPGSDTKPLVVKGFTVYEVHDGDTPKGRVVIRPGPEGVEVTSLVRVKHINSPEISAAVPKCEQALGLAARDWAVHWYAETGYVVDLAGVIFDKFGGRVRADVLSRTGAVLGIDEVAAGHAMPYEGEARPPGLWCTDPAP